MLSVRIKGRLRMYITKSLRHISHTLSITKSRSIQQHPGCFTRTLRRDNIATIDPVTTLGCEVVLNSSSSLCEQYHSIITHSSIHLRRTLTLSDEGDPSGAPLFSYLGNGDFGLVGFQWFAGEAQSAIQSSGQVAFIRAAPIVDWIQTTIDFRRRL